MSNRKTKSAYILYRNITDRWQYMSKPVVYHVNQTETLACATLEDANYVLDWHSKDDLKMVEVVTDYYPDRESIDDWLKRVCRLAHREIVNNGGQVGDQINLTGYVLA